MVLRRFSPALLVGACVLLGAASGAQAATFTVNDTADAPLASLGSTSCVSTHGGSCTLRAAVQAADNAGGSNQIVLRAGNYKLTIAPATASTAGDPATGDLDVIGLGALPDSLTISGAGSGQTIVDANHVDRAFAVQSGDALTLAGMTIENGEPGANSTASDEGGAVYSDGALSVTSDVVFAGNVGSGDGGAIYSDAAAGSTLSLNGATFSGDSAPFGGAIYDNVSGAASITDSTFNSDAADPSSGLGGAIAVDSGDLTVSSSRFQSDAAGGGGGAIYWNSTGNLTVSGSTFTSNTADKGGAIRDDSSASTTLTGDQFVNNGGGSYGGALYLNSGATYTLTSDELDGNSSSKTGGAVAWEAGALVGSGTSFIANRAGQSGGALQVDAVGPLSLTNTTISANAAPQGAGIEFTGGSVPVSLVNDTITNNTAMSGGGVYDPAAAAMSSSVGVLNTIVALNAGGDCNAAFAAGADAGNNLDSDGSCFGGLGVGSDLTSVSSPLIAQAAANGGPVQTAALEPGSPAINAGSASGCPATDARGVARPQGSGCDIGAYEVASAGLSLSGSAPNPTIAGVPFDLTFTVTGTGAGPSTATTLTAPLPAGTVLYGVAQSQGSCTGAGSPATVNCDLGAISSGSTATVVVIVAAASPGALTFPASSTNGEGASGRTSVATSAVGAGGVGTRPVATSGRASSATTTSVLLSGGVTAGGSTAYFFQYGTTKSYGQATPVRTTTSTASVSIRLAGLEAATRYHYRLVAINSAGVSYGSDRTFTTLGPRRAAVSVWIKHLVRIKWPLIYTFSGRLKLPDGVSRKDGCVGRVRVAVKVIRNGKLVTASSVRLARDCTYTAVLRVTPPWSVPPAGKLEVVARFLGTHLLPRTSSKALTLPHG